MAATETINDRLIRLIDELDLNPNSFALKTGISSGVMHHLVSGRKNKPSPETLEKICLAFPNVNIRALITGIGELVYKTENIDANTSIETTISELLALKDYTISVQKMLIEQLLIKKSSRDKESK